MSERFIERWRTVAVDWQAHPEHYYDDRSEAIVRGSVEYGTNRFVPYHTLGWRERDRLVIWQGVRRLGLVEPRHTA